MPKPTRPTTARRAGAIAALLALLVACATTPIEPWATTEPLNAPESVYLDPDSDALFVSQVGLRPGGTPVDKDGNGVISKLTKQGTVVNANWVTGLNSPKGMRSQRGTLWVADVDEVSASTSPAEKSSRARGSKAPSSSTTWPPRPTARCTSRTC